MDKTKDPLYSDKYKTTDFVWGQTLGEGKFQAQINLLSRSNSPPNHFV